MKIKTLTSIILLFLTFATASAHTINDKNAGYNNKRVYAADTTKRDSILHHNLLMDHPRSYLFKRPVFVSAKYFGGKSLTEDSKVPTGYVQYTDIRVGVTSLGNRWKDIVYGMPYYGIGMGFHDFSSKYTGHPITAYLFQGATLRSFSARSSLKYEWNFGASFNWKEYDPVTNPRNECIGKRANIYFAANLYFNYVLNKEWDISLGATLNHVSNGATKMPNTGINTATAFVGLTYYFDRERIVNEFNPTLRAPLYDQSRLISDITFNTTVRQRKFDMEETGLSSPYINKNFFVASASYALLHMPTYKYRYGTGIDLTYDESAGFSARKVGETPKGVDIAEFKDGKFGDRLALGLSVRGDIVMPKYSVSGIVGYEVIKGKKVDSRLYQAFNVKVPFWDNLYGSFTIRSQKFSKAQYMFFGIGYMIDHKPFKLIKQ
ncbi:acyloxyacyl hydrolase [Bacteroides sp. 51]|uniref:acyloxyacyl hydrolase n=1 Tax=Bacteroides sp. 51 TaxID=2302938 RepID=UPI0013D7E2AA|nr:acyloxyacyl hydrolase [Bacteroides sp. 51]NDV81095.1 hypothetical protein [Bacteroides sp. 51]